MYNGMKGYIRLVCLFLLPIMLLLGSMEHGLRQIPNDYSFKSQRMINDGASFEFLVLGNSHAYLGVDPDQMGSVGFNAANISPRIAIRLGVGGLDTEMPPSGVQSRGSSFLTHRFVVPRYFRRKLARLFSRMPRSHLRNMSSVPPANWSKSRLASRSVS